MKKILSLILAISLSFSAVSAEEIKTDMQRISQDSYQIQENSSENYEFKNQEIQEIIKHAWLQVKMGWKIAIDKEIDWKLVVFWGKTKIDKKVNGDIFVFSWDVAINNEINGTLFVLWWNVEINGKINQDAHIIAWEALIWENSIIEWDVWILWWKVTHKGKINWNLEIEAGEKNLEWEVLWITTESNSLKEITSEEKWLLSMETALDLVSIILFSGLLLFLIENKFDNLAKIMFERWWRSALYSILFLLFFPFFCILIMITIIGIPVWIIWLIIYGIFLVLNAYLAVPSMYWIIKLKLNKELKNYEKLGIIVLLSIFAVIFPLLTLSFAIFVSGAILVSLFHKN